jgi:LL-diaminopimelate aminotransferase
MTDQPIQFKPADRIANFKPYFFTILNKKILDLTARGMDVVRIDMGSPDLPPADFIVDALYASAKKPDAHGYSPYPGSLKFRKSVASYYKNRFGVELDPVKEILTLIGSKEGLFNLCQTMLNPGDIALVPDPGYPVYFAAAEIAGAEVYHMPLLAENRFLPDLKSIPADVLQRAKMIWINYPNNPTGAVADGAFYNEIIAFAHRHNILIASDAPYTDVCFDGYRAESIMQYPGAKDVTVEFNSLSKTYNMAGWRLGMAVGNAQVIDYLSTYKSQVDSSQFQAIMDAGAAALTEDQDWLDERNEIYQHRRDLILRSMKKMGLQVIPPRAAIYMWVKIPDGAKSEEFCDRLLTEAGVSTTPGTVYGDYGEGYLRISLGSPTDRIQLAMERFSEWMKKY